MRTCSSACRSTMSTGGSTVDPGLVARAGLAKDRLQPCGHRPEQRVHRRGLEPPLPVLGEAEQVAHVRRQRRTWSAIRSSASRSDWGREGSLRRSSARLSTAASGLLISCATPDTTRPIALRRSCSTSCCWARCTRSYAIRRSASSARTRSAIRSNACASAAISSPRSSPTEPTSRSPAAICVAAARSRSSGETMLRASMAASSRPMPSAASATSPAVRAETTSSCP